MNQTNAQVQIPNTPEAMLDLLGSMSEEELQELFEANQQLEQQIATQGPQNRDELHSWVKHELGVDIPRHTVCEGHCAPFDFLADLYFEDVEAAIGVANRGGSKTFIVAVLHWLNSKFKAGVESCTFGAVENQSYRAYSHLKVWAYDEDGERKPEVVSSMMRETIFANGSMVNILGSTPEQVNGPHPQKAHADEIELMRDDTWQESRNMTVGKTLKDGRVIKAQDISTSTRKGPNGRVQNLINEIEQAVREGYKPPRTLYIWCQKETASENPACQMVSAEQRESRLKELDRDPCEVCDCDKIRKGQDEDGNPRLLKDVCGGDFFRSRGWQPFSDVIKQFTENDPETYEAQVLCQKPEMKWHYLPTFTEEHHGLRDFMPDPANGPIFTSVDWGGSNPHAINWYQLLKFDIDVPGYNGDPVRVREGTLVCFDEIYIAEIGNERLGEMVKAKEASWKEIYPNFRVWERYSDPQGKAARLDWKAMGLKTTWHTTREKEEQFKAIREMMTDDLFRVDVTRCKMWIAEAKAWRKNPNTDDELDENFNHAMSAFRYMVINLKKIRKKALNMGGPTPSAKSIPRKAMIIDTRKAKGPVGFSGRTDEYAKWRQRLGEPVTQRRN